MPRRVGYNWGMSDERTYIHGFTEDERDRLSRQALSLEPYVFGHLDYSRCRHIIEVGCGVGAQMKILLRRWPRLKVTGIDREPSQIAAARRFMASQIAAGQALFLVGEGDSLPFPDDHFDGAFLCWMLEHVQDTHGIMAELRRVMRPGAVLYDTEVFNSGLCTDPPCPAMRSYWATFNAYQRRLGGDPDIGMKLKNLAMKVGFASATLHSVEAKLDRDVSKPSDRAAFLDYWHELLLTAAPHLLAEEGVSQTLIDEMGREFVSLREDFDSVFVYRLFQLRAVSP